MLQEAKVSYAIVEPLQKMFCLALKEYDLVVPKDLEALVEPIAQYGPEELLDACTRISYRQPLNQIIPNMASSLSMDFMHVRKQLDGRSGANHLTAAEAVIHNRMQITSLLNF